MPRQKPNARARQLDAGAPGSMANAAQGKVYRGRRRLPKLPGRRYFAVVTTAFMGASVVALSAGAVVPDELATFASGTPLLEDRLAAADQASRADDYGPAVSVDSNAPDVWVLPIRDGYQITSNFEMRWGTMHFGVDMAAPEGTPIYAPHAGTVILSGPNGGYGLAIEIDHGDGIIIIYGHCSSLFVTKGQQVQAGQLIAYVGNTGFSTGAHLHFEVRIHGGQYDPRKFLRERGVDIVTRQEEANGDVLG